MKKMKKMKKTICFLAGMLLAALALSGFTEDEAAYDGWIFRTLPSECSLFEEEPVLQWADCIEPVWGDIYKTTSAELLEELEDSGRLLYAEPDYWVELEDSPDDPCLLDGSQYWTAMLGQKSAWRAGITGRKVRIGMLDSGLYSGHEDFRNAHIPRGWNYCSDSPDTSDDVGHGTFAAGIVAAQVNNGLGIAGIAPEAEIVPLKCFDSKSGKVSDIVKAILGGVDTYHCDILNMSFGLEKDPQTLRDAVSYAQTHDVWCVSAVGNLPNGTSSTGNDALMYPAAYEAVIGVGAVDRFKTVASFSYQNQSVFIAAPGKDLIGLGNTAANSYVSKSGTSFAAPMVTAAAALARSIAPTLSNQDFQRLLSASADDLGAAGYDFAYGHGLLNIERLLSGMAQSVSGYDVTKDAYSFANQKSSFGYASTSAGENYPIPYESVRCLFGDGVRGKYIYKNMIRYPWNGNCCGMAATSALMYDGTAVTEQDFGSSYVSDLQITQTNAELDALDLKTFIEAMQTAQYTDRFSRVYKGNQLYQIHLKNGSTLNGLYEAVREDVGRRQATLLAIGKDGVGAHALLAYGVEENGAEITMQIYDCNYPLESRSMTLRASGGEATEWSYDMGGSYGVWGSDDPYCFISYVPYSVMETIWKNRGNPGSNCELLTVNSGNVSIKNFAGEVVAELKDGKLITDADDVYELPGLTMTETSVTAIYLPKDCYTITNTAEDFGEFEAGMADVYSGAVIQTTAQTVSFAVDDQDGSNFVVVENATASDSYCVSLDSSVQLGGSISCRNVTVSGSGRTDGGGSIRIGSTNGTISISGECVIGSLLVDGQEQIYYTITASASEGGRISPVGDSKVMAGGSAAFQFVPDAGYFIKDVQVDGNSIGKVTSYTFENVGDKHFIRVEFEKGPYCIANAELDGNTLTAEVKTAGSATLIGAVYSQDGVLLASGREALTESGTAAIHFAGFVPPETCRYKLFLVDGSYRPLCGAYPLK